MRTSCCGSGAGVAGVGGVAGVAGVGGVSGVGDVAGVCAGGSCGSRPSRSSRGSRGSRGSCPGPSCVMMVPPCCSRSLSSHHPQEGSAHAFRFAFDLFDGPADLNGELLQLSAE